MTEEVSREFVEKMAHLLGPSSGAQYALNKAATYPAGTKVAFFRDGPYWVVRAIRGNSPERPSDEQEV